MRCLGLGIRLQGFGADGSGNFSYRLRLDLWIWGQGVQSASIGPCTGRYVSCNREKTSLSEISADKRSNLQPVMLRSSMLKRKFQT